MDASDWLLFVKSFELPLVIVAIWTILSQLVKRISWRGLFIHAIDTRRFYRSHCRVHRSAEECLAHDFALATLLLFVAVALRIGDATWALYTEGEQWLGTNFVHASLTAIGVSWIIRILAPETKYNLYSFAATLASLVYASLVVASKKWG